MIPAGDHPLRTKSASSCRLGRPGLLSLRPRANDHLDDRPAAAWFEVQHADVPALRLYERAGLREIRGYHYRTAGG